MLYMNLLQKKSKQQLNNMAIPFEDSKRALEQQLSAKLDVVHLVLLLFLATLLFWAVSGEIDIYRTSVGGTLKTQGGAIVIESEVDATIKQSHLKLGAAVKRDTLLLELEDQKAKLELDKLRNELAANEQQQDILLEQQKLTVQKYQLLSTRLKNEIEQTRAQLEQSQKVLQTQISIQQGMEQLASSSAVAKMDLLKQNLEVVRAEAASKVHSISLDNKSRQLPANEREKDLALNQISAQLSGLKDRAGQLQKSIDAAKLEVAKYRLYAGKDGEVVQLSELAQGNKVAKGQKLATISDGSGWLLQTRFKAADAVGHIATGQTARVLVDGFPWRQYGSLSATVSHVAKEGSNSHVEVHLKLDENSNSRIPLTFGQPVTVEIKTEAITPLMLLLNAFDRAQRGQSNS